MNSVESMSPTTAVVTGPTGALGSALVRHLASIGVTVFALVRPGSNRVGNLPKTDKVYIMECSLDSLALAPKAVRNLGFRSCDVWFHLGWTSTFGADARNDMSAQVANIQSALDAVSAADELGCSVFVGAGSQAEYGRSNEPLRPDTPTFPENGYGIAKLAAGMMTKIECEKRGIRHEWVRILSVYGPYDNPNTLIAKTLRQLIEGQKPSVTAGEQLWDYLYSDDAARALYAAASKGRHGSVYCLGSGKAQPLRAYIEQMRDYVNPSLPIGFGEVSYTENQVMFLQADISTLSVDTGFIPMVSFDEGIKLTAAWMKRNDFDSLQV